MKPMLCAPVDLSAVDALIESDEWHAQQKLDGDRLLIHVVDGKATALNREGIPRRNAVPARVLAEFRLDGEWFFDGELLDDGTLWLFDLPFAAGLVTGEDPFRFRVDVLERLFVSWKPAPCVRLLSTVRGAAAKRRLFEQVRESGGEGVVFKRDDSRYLSGRRSTGMQKAKFTNTADVVVSAVRPEGRNNCLIELYDNGVAVPVGSVSLEGKPAVSVGDVIEVRYLYAGTEHHLVQPRMLRRRHDKTPSSCTLDQLHYTNREVVHVPVRFTYRATGRRGVDMVGVFVDEEPGEFARVRFHRRWRWLEILDEAGAHVGGIQPHPEHGRRIWWG